MGDTEHVVTILTAKRTIHKNT